MIDILDIVTLDNDIDYVVGAKTKIYDSFYYCLVNENNPEDLLICKSSDEVNLTEVTDSEVIKRVASKVL